MNDSICHRGPDDAGEWHGEAHGLWFGHRRLSIIDLSAEGHQPKASHTDRFVIAFNGEIYNYRTLRDELRTVGHSFRGESDTEVILTAFEQWGVEAATSRFAGMFAFAVFDRADGRLWLGRDRLGEKPLYVGWAGDTLLFGSELKAMTRHPSWEGEIDRAALTGFLRNGYVPGAQSIYRGIAKVVPGTLLSFDVARRVREPSTHVYWSLRQVIDHARTQPFTANDADATSQLDSLLRTVVGEQMVADVPLGAFLSGGIDSSLIVGIMQALSGSRVRTFTIGFEEAGFNEADHAMAVARHLGTDHTEMYVTPAAARDVIPRLPTLYDEPFADPSQIPTFLVAELARRHVTVSLSGDGGDELFGGYNRYFHGQRAWRSLRSIPSPLRRLAARGARTVPARTWNRAAAVVSRALPVRYRAANPGDKIHKLAEVLEATGPDDFYGRLTTHWREAASIVRGSPEGGGHADAAASDDFLSHMMYADAVGYLPDDILVKVDRATMGVSLESRAPFLDHRVAEFAWHLPISMKVRDGQGKWILRQVLDRYVPKALIDRPKMGFGVPIDSWLRGPLREWAEELLAPERMQREGLLDPVPIHRKWQEHVAGTRNWQYLLWDVLMFQAWNEARSLGR